MSQQEMFNESMSLPEVSRARTSHGPERGEALITTYLSRREPGLVFGGKCGESYAIFDPDTSLLKTYQRSLIEDSTLYSEALPKSGMMRSGRLYQRQAWAHRTLESESSSSRMRTPTASDSTTHWSDKKRFNSLAAEVQKERDEGWEKYACRTGLPETSDSPGPFPSRLMFPTPRVFMYKDAKEDRGKGNIGEVVMKWATPRSSMWKATGREPSNQKRIAESGAVNIEEQAADRATGWRLSTIFVAWLMGFPTEWAHLKDTEMPLSPKSDTSSDEQ